jgi:hypothetical protein
VTDQHQSIDLRTLEKVHQLLRTAEFATVDDLLARSDVSRLGQATDRPAATSPSVAATQASARLAPLPRRR